MHDKILKLRKAMVHGEVVSTLGYLSGGPRFESPPRPGCTSPLLSVASHLQNFINRSETKVAFIYVMERLA